MSDEPLILVVGGDALAVRVCEELCSTRGHRVALVWPHDHEIAKRIEQIEFCQYLPFAPNDYDGLREVGVMDALSIMALADDDRINLQVALKARDMNPKIRVVLRQFNRTLGRKLEQNLPNCSVLSMESHSAAALVGAALDPTCFYALQFPDNDGVLCGFSERAASEFRIAGMNRDQAQSFLKMRVIACDGQTEWDLTRRFAPEDRVICFGELRLLMATERRAPGGSRHRGAERRKHAAPEVDIETDRPSMRQQFAGIARRIVRMDPILRTVVLLSLIALFVSTIYFSFALKKDGITAFYFVMTTMTTVGYGDISPLEAGPLAKLVANALMVIGLGLSGIVIAFVTTALTRAQWTAMQGLRQIKTRQHVLVCGAGNVGTRVVEFLRGLDQKVVVVDTNPDNALIEQSRLGDVELLTGDGTRDSTLDLCNVLRARSVVAVTSVDTVNLEVALGVRGRNSRLPVVMRVQDDTFALSIERQFDGIKTLSTSALAAPSFAGLSRFPGTRARIAFGDDDYNVGERPQGEKPAPPPAKFCVALAVWRNGAFLHINDFEEMLPFDRLLFIVPLSQFRAGAPRRERQSVPLANAR
jgi:Trk K+ transport system NAD-binding subunit